MSEEKRSGQPLEVNIPRDQYAPAAGGFAAFRSFALSGNTSSQSDILDAADAIRRMLAPDAEPPQLPVVNSDDSITWKETTYGNLHPDASALFRLLIKYYPVPIEVSQHLEAVKPSRVKSSLIKTARPLAELIKSQRGKGTVLDI